MGICISERSFNRFEGSVTECIDTCGTVQSIFYTLRVAIENTPRHLQADLYTHTHTITHKKHVERVKKRFFLGFNWRDFSRSFVSSNDKTESRFTILRPIQLHVWSKLQWILSYISHSHSFIIQCNDTKTAPTTNTLYLYFQFTIVPFYSSRRSMGRIKLLHVTVIVAVLCIENAQRKYHTEPRKLWLWH